jgi:hypothetical protein
MFAWLRKLDESLFSPPHKFKVILDYVNICLIEANEAETAASPALANESSSTAGYTSRSK